MTSKSPPKPKLPRLPFILLGLMTLFSFGGPLLIGYVLAGGSSDRWPPDRTIEWATFIGISAMVAILMAACLSLALVHRKPMMKVKEATEVEASRSQP